MRIVRGERLRPARAPARDDDRWADAYREHGERLTRFATVLVGPADAADLVAETMQRVMHRRPTLADRDLAAYLTRALVNAANSHHRSRSRRQRRDEWAAATEAIAPIDVTNAVDVARALTVLSPQQRAIVALVFWDDLTLADVALRLGVSEGSVRRQYARAKHRLREVLR